MNNIPLSAPATIDRRNFLQLLGASATTVGVVGTRAATTPAPALVKKGAIKLTILYGHPTDAAAFEKYYAETHLPIAAKITGFTRTELSKILPGIDGAKAAHYRMAEFCFESLAAMQACLESPEAKAAGDDLKNFGTGGVTLFASEVTG